MKMKVEFEVDVKEVRKMAVLMELEIPTDEEIMKLENAEVVFPDSMKSKDFSMLIATIALISMEKYKDYQKPVKEEKQLSKFQQRLKDAGI